MKHVAEEKSMATISDTLTGPESEAVETQKSINLRKRIRLSESLIQGFLFFCGAVSILTTIGIVVVLLEESLRFFADPAVNVFEFITGAVWQPQLGKFGILPLLTATLVTTFIAMLVAAPLGLAVSVYLSEYASLKARTWIKPTLEILAGIPTVVYGYFALTWMTPMLREIFGKDTVNIYNTASAGLVMGVLLLPLVATISEDALHAVPNALREAAYGLGATRLETSIKVVLPAAISGIAAALILAFSRAVGETMIVAIAAGNGPNFTLNPFKGAETITGHIVRISGGDLSYDSIDYNSLFALALALFLITLLLNFISQKIVRKFREEYE